jgi:hypothetical protein
MTLGHSAPSDAKRHWIQMLLSPAIVIRMGEWIDDDNDLHIDVEAIDIGRVTDVQVTLSLSGDNG